MLTDTGDTVFDPFAGSCVTGEVCEMLERSWICCETVTEYVDGAKGRFEGQPPASNDNEPDHYKIFSPSVLWNGSTEEYEDLPDDGGRKRPQIDENDKTLPPVVKAKRKAEKPREAQQPTLFDY
jgi:site-specific DNA-methyltransferase (cytosine-N4-specific)